MKKLSSFIRTALAMLFCLAVIIPQTALASTAMDTEKDVTLTLTFRDGETALKGVTFKLYRVADVDGASEFTATDDFSGYGVSLDSLDTEEWSALADTLSAYAARDTLIPADSGETNAAGQLVFPTQGKRMAPGLYLVVGRQTTVGEYIYTPQPFLICLPDRTADWTWDYDVEASLKYDREELPAGTVQRKVLKVWSDSSGSSKRPEYVDVQLLRDGEVYETVRLNAENDWQYKWTELEAGRLWQVTEKSVPDGYTVSVTRQGITFVVTNTLKSGGTGDTPKNPTLPQTGMLWWPVPVLAASGLGLFMLGWLRYKKHEEE